MERLERSGSTVKKGVGERHNTPSRPGSVIEYKLESIRKEIQRQYQPKHSITSREKENPNPNCKKSILETKKLKRAILESEEERFKDKYNRLQEEHLQEKREFLVTIERFNMLKSTVENYFRSPFSESNIERLKSFYLGEAAESYADKVLNLAKENEELKSHVEKLLEMFDMNDFEDMLKELSTLNEMKMEQAQKEKQREREEEEINRLKRDLLERGRDIEKILEKLSGYEMKIDGMREESERTGETIEELERLNEKLEEARGLVEEECGEVRREADDLKRENKRLRGENENLKRVVEKLQESLADLEEERELTKVNVDERLVDGNRIQSLLSQNRELIGEVDDLKLELAQVREGFQKHEARDNSETKKSKEILNLIYSKLQCEPQQALKRITILVASQQQLKISSTLLQQFSNNIETLMAEIKQHKQALEQVTLQKDEYKFLLSSLNKEIEVIRKQEKGRTEEMIQIGESNFRKSTKDLTLKHDILVKEMDQYRHETAFYKQESESLLSRNEKLSADILSFQAEVRELRIDNSKLRLDIDMAVKGEREANIEKQKSLLNLGNTTKRYNKQVEVLKKSLQEITVEVEKLRVENFGVRGELERENNILREELRVAESDVKLRDEEIGFKNREYLIELEVQKRSVKELEKTVSESSTLLSKLNIQIDQLRVTNMRLTQQRDRHKQESQQATKHLQEQIEAMGRRSEETIKKSKQKQELIEEVSMEVKQLEREKEILQKKLQEKSKEYDRKVGEDKRELEEVLRKKDKLKGDFERIVKDYEVFKMELEEVRAEKNQLVVVNQELNRAMEALKQSQIKADLEGVSSSLREQYDSLKYSNIEKDNLLLELQDINATLSNKAKDLEYLVSEKTQHIKEMNLQLTSFKESMENLLDESKIHKKEINQLLDELNDAKKYIEGETDRIKEVIRMLGEDADTSEISRFDEIKQVYRMSKGEGNKQPDLAKLKKNLLELSIVQAPKLKYQDNLSPSSSISKDFNFRQNNDNDDNEAQAQLERTKTQNQQLKGEIRNLEKKIVKLENDQNTATLKAMIGKFFEALLTEDSKKESELLESIRIILKILDFSSGSREDILEKVAALRKKKAGFFSFLK